MMNNHLSVIIQHQHALPQKLIIHKCTKAISHLIQKPLLMFFNKLSKINQLVTKLKIYRHFLRQNNPKTAQSQTGSPFKKSITTKVGGAAFKKLKFAKKCKPLTMQRKLTRKIMSVCFACSPMKNH